MPNRRRFLQSAAALSAAPAMAGAVHAAPPSPIWLMIYDDRYAPARAAGRAALAEGARVRRIAGDVTGLWSSELQAGWREHQRPIAGVTARDALFCLEQLGWDARMRVAYRQTLNDEPAHDIARALLAGPLDAAAPEPLGGMAEGEHDEHALYAWVIAPARTRARSA